MIFAAQIRQIKVIFVSFATVKKPPIADIFIKGRGKSLKSLAAEILSHAPNKESKSNPHRQPHTTTTIY